MAEPRPYQTHPGILVLVATWMFPGPVNVPDEATYWTTQVDKAGHPLSGHRNYVMHFPASGLPPNEAFWSLTMGDASNRFVPQPDPPIQRERPVGA